MFRKALFVTFLVISIILTIQITTINAGGSSVIDWSAGMIADKMVDGSVFSIENRFGHHIPEEHDNNYYAAE